MSTEFTSKKYAKQLVYCIAEVTTT